MYLKILDELSRIRKCSMGKYQTLQKLEKKIYTVFFKKTNEVKILKKVSESEYGLFCTYKKNLKKTNKNKYGCKGEFTKNLNVIMFKEEIKEKKNVYSFYWSINPWEFCESIKVCKSTAFLNEVSINLILKEYVSYYSMFFCNYESAWKSKRQGNILMDYGGKCLLEVCKYLELLDLKCIVFQILVALSWSQKQIHFKHQDMHTGNIYVLFDDDKEGETTEIQVSKNWSLEDTQPQHFVKKRNKKENIESVLFRIPKRIKVKIADFGFSSATNPKTLRRHCRADFEMLEQGKKWGIFDENLYGNEGYDMLYFLSILKQDVNDRESLQWIKSIITKIFELQGSKIKISSYGRPLEKCKVHPHQLIFSEFFENWNMEKKENRESMEKVYENLAHSILETSK
jgi:serine/threonine protein kinase